MSDALASSSPFQSPKPSIGAASPPVVPLVSRGLLPRGLLVLILLRYKSVLRRMFFGSGKRRLFTFLGIGVVAVGVLPQLLINRKSFLTPDVVRLWLPPLLVLFVAVQLIARSKRDPVVFQPAEIDLVVPGPFSRRQLVLYQVVYQVGPLIAMGLWMGLFFRAGGSYLSGAVGTSLLFFAINLLSGIIGSGLGILNNISRAIVPAIAAVLAALLFFAVRSAPPYPRTAVLDDWLKWAVELRGTPIIELLGLPARPFAETLASVGLLEMLPWALLAAAINLGLVAAFIVLDRGEVETLVTRSQAVLAKIEKFRKPGLALSGAKVDQRRVAMLPRLGGAGPLLWRQLTVFYRLTGPAVVAAVGAAVLAGGFVIGRFTPDETLIIATVTIGIGGCLAVSLVVRADFRSDLDHMPLLKTLPVSPMAVVLAQLATPVLVTVSMQCLAMAGIVAGAGSVAGVVSAPEAGGLRIALVGLLVALGSVPLGVVLVAIENAVFLVTPVRPLTSSMQSGFDPAALGRTMVVTFTKFLVVAGAAAVVGGPAAGVWYVAGAVPAVVVAVLIASALLTALIFLCAKAFTAFNVADDQPG